MQSYFLIIAGFVLFTYGLAVTNRSKLEICVGMGIMAIGLLLLVVGLLSPGAIIPGLNLTIVLGIAFAAVVILADIWQKIRKSIPR